MSSSTQIKETRTVFRDADGNQKFRISLECTDKGSLNDKGVFVFQIFNSRNASADIFQRIAEVADVETYSNDRDMAVLNGDEYWRSSSHVLEFDDIEVATAAVRTISDRVNKLVNDFVTYQTEFEASGKILDFPTATPAVIDERKSDYQDAVTAYETAVEDGADAISARDDAQAALDTANAILQEWQEEKDKICGGNLSGKGEKVGLKPEMDDVGNAFLELLNGSGSFSWLTNAEEFKNDVQAFYDSATKIVSGSSTSAFLKCSVAVTSNPASATDIGKPVFQSSTGITGYLNAIENIDGSNQYWWISDAAGMSNGSVTLDGNSGYTVTVVDASGASPYKYLLDTLNSQLSDMQAALNEALKYEDTANDALSDHTDVCTSVTNTVSTKTAAATTAANELKTKEAAATAAEGTIAAAYDDVIKKYEAVKEVCPSWSPDPSLPAQP